MCQSPANSHSVGYLHHCQKWKRFPFACPRQRKTSDFRTSRLPFEESTQGVFERRWAIRWTVPTPNPSSLAIERQEAPDAPRPSIWDSRYFLPAIERAGLRHFRIHDPGTPLHRSCYALSRSLWTFKGTSSQARTLRGLIGSTRRQVSNKMQRPRNWMKWMSRRHRWKCLIIMVAPGRVELPTSGLGNRCSIHLSYGAACC